MKRSLRVYVWLGLGMLLYAGATGLYLWMNRFNTVPELSQGSAADPAVFMTQQELSNSESYPAIRSWLFFLYYPWEWGIYIVMLVSGWSSRLEAGIRRTGMWIPAGFILFVTAISFVASICLLPLRYISYRVSYHYGISTQPILGWLRDKLVQFGVDTLLILAVTAVVFLFMKRWKGWWWRLGLLAIPFILFLTYIQPVVIDPLYHQFSPLSDPDLESSILELADKAGVPVDRVYEVNMSEKTNALNAYVNGVGSSLRIVLWDTLYRLQQDEILLIVAHEMGHYTAGHLEWSTFGAAASAFVMLGIGSWILKLTLGRWGDSWGIRTRRQWSILSLLLLLMSVLSFASLPLSNLVSRQAERYADEYSYKLIGSSEGAATLQQNMAKATYDQAYPPLLVRLFRSTHPSTWERIVYAEQYGKQ